MNGQYIYLSGIENTVWFKKRESLLMHIVKIQYLNILVGGVNYIQLKRIMIY